MGNYWHSENIEDLLDQYGVDDNGLSNDEAEERLKQYGSNELERAKKRHPIFLFFEQFKDPLVIILLVALIISVTIGIFSPDEHQRMEYFIDAIAISAIVMFNAFFGFVQEYKAEKSIEALKSMAAPFSTVIREGKKQRIEAQFLVPGDIILIEEGDKIPADGRLLESHSLRVDESALTGESFPAAKEAMSQVLQYAPIADMENSVFSGTSVTRGRGQALIIKTGMQTEFGKIAKGLLEEKTEETPLQRRLATLGKWIGIGSLTICAVIFFIGILLNQEAIEMFIVAVGLAVAAVPEGLPAVVTLALALGVQRMSRKNAIIRRLPSVETLGSTTVICSDKTGTLTRNKMTVRKILTVDEEYRITKKIPLNNVICLILTIGLECNNAQLAESKEGGSTDVDIGDPTEIALLRVAKRMDVLDRSKYKRLFEVPFDSDSKRMSVLVKNLQGEHFVYTKGAPDVLINLCKYYYSNGEIKPLDQDTRYRLEEAEQNLAKTGYRMLGMAYKSVDPVKDKIERVILSEDSEEIESNLVYVGAMAIMDPPRQGTKKSIEICKKAGIRPVMITGDHLKTAVAVATEIGLVSSEDSSHYLEGNQLANMSDEEFESIVGDVNVYARVSPEHKLKIVSALKSNNQIVAMTGDGVNDAPALKRADIGVAMGIAGTDVSKEASDMILADDDFSTIVGAILEGRTIYDNMRKFILYLLSCNAGEIAVMFFGILLTSLIFQTPILPLLAIQILWVNLVTDGLPALAMGVDPPDPDVMIRHPRDPKEPILTHKSIFFIIYSGIIIAIGTLLLFFLYMYSNVLTGQLPSEEVQIHARTVAFTMLIMFQMIMALNIRKEEHSLLGKEFFRNPYLLLAIASSILLHILIVYSSFFQPFFNTTALNAIDWVIIIASGSILVIVDEVRTFLAHRIPRLGKLAGYW
ncbi:MAG: calcium-translocating P-type ATPase, PMCA-type [Candidatus Heimdallarchaeota archaeon]|nr:MAG: calcium-translocating P-type ATPase, PMCA-type [Candidatus Heimdallarchaeota archaeon]